MNWNGILKKHDLPLKGNEKKLMVFNFIERLFLTLRSNLLSADALYEITCQITIIAEGNVFRLWQFTAPRPASSGFILSQRFILSSL